MADLKARLSALLDDDEDVQPLTRFETPIDFVPKTAEELSANDSTEGLMIYEATPAEINYWHAFGSNLFLQQLLARYGLDFYRNVQAFNHFKIGFDKSRHFATFAVDENHYYAIEFDDYNTTPKYKKQAESVLLLINKIRQATRRIELFCGVPIEKFDEPFL